MPRLKRSIGAAISCGGGSVAPSVRRFACTPFAHHEGAGDFFRVADANPSILGCIEDSCDLI